MNSEIINLGLLIGFIIMIPLYIKDIKDTKELKNLERKTNKTLMQCWKTEVDQVNLLNKIIKGDFEDE